jgi:hypothetical protein
MVQHLDNALDRWSPGGESSWPELAEAVLTLVGDSEDGEALVHKHPDLFRRFAVSPLLSDRAELEAFVDENSDELAAIAEELHSPPPGTVFIPTAGYRAMRTARRMVRAAHEHEPGKDALHSLLREHSRTSAFAWMMLGVRGDTSVLELALDLLPEGGVNRSARNYLKSLPAKAGLPVARMLVARGDEPYAEAGWSILVEHATAADVPLIHAAFEAALAAGDFDHVVVVLNGLILHPSRGPYPAARGCFESAPYAVARFQAARLLSLTDPGFAEEFAFECLWDCDPDTQQLAAQIVAPATCEIRDRVAKIASASLP